MVAVSLITNADSVGYPLDLVSAFQRFRRELPGRFYQDINRRRLVYVDHYGIRSKVENVEHFFEIVESLASVSWRDEIGFVSRDAFFRFVVSIAPLVEYDNELLSPWACPASTN